MLHISFYIPRLGLRDNTYAQMYVSSRVGTWSSIGEELIFSSLLSDMPDKLGSKRQRGKWSNDEVGRRLSCIQSTSGDNFGSYV